MESDEISKLNPIYQYKPDRDGINDKFNYLSPFDEVNITDNNIKY